MNNWKKIVENNIKLVYYFSRNEDEQGAGMLGLVKGAKTYDPKLGYKLSTYLGKCILNEIKIWYRKNNKYYNELPMAEEDLPFIRSNSVEDEVIKQEDLSLLNIALDKLDKRARDLISHYFGLEDYEKLTQTELSKRFNISQAQISRIIKKNLKFIKENFYE